MLVSARQLVGVGGYSGRWWRRVYMCVCMYACVYHRCLAGNCIATTRVLLQLLSFGSAVWFAQRQNGFAVNISSSSNDSMNALLLFAVRKARV